MFTNQIAAYEAAPSVYRQRAYYQMFPAATANARKYILLVTNMHNVIIFDLEDKIRDDLLNLNVPYQFAMKRNLITLIIAAVLVMIFALLLFTFQVRQSEVAVVTTFGKITGPPREPGLHLRWPWPIQQVYKFDQRIQNFEDKFSENLTADSITLMTSVYVGWKISDAAAFLNNFRDGSIAAAQSQLQSMLTSAKSAVVGSNTLVRFCERGPEAA